MDIHEVNANLNFLAIAAGTIAGMLVGAVYFAPRVLGRIWLRTLGQTSEQVRAANAGRMAAVWIVTLVLTAVMAYTLSVVIALAGVGGLTGGVATGFHMWLGFALPAVVFPSLFSGKSVQSIAVTTGHHLAILIVMGAVIGSLS